MKAFVAMPPDEGLFLEANAGTKTDRENVASILLRYKDKEPTVTSK